MTAVGPVHRGLRSNGLHQFEALVPEEKGGSIHSCGTTCGVSQKKEAEDWGIQRHVGGPAAG